MLSKNKQTITKQEIKETNKLIFFHNLLNNQGFNSATLFLLASFLLALFFQNCDLIFKRNFRGIKKYIEQEPPYLMRQICVLQWEEIKTKNSGATHHFCPKGGIRIYSYCIFHIDQKAKNHKYSL